MFPAAASAGLGPLATCSLSWFIGDSPATQQPTREADHTKHSQNGPRPSKAPRGRARGPHASPRNGERAAPRVAGMKCVCPHGIFGCAMPWPQGGVAEWQYTKLDRIETRKPRPQHQHDRLLANGAAMAAARRKTGGLQWGDFPWESGAKNHRKTTGPWSPSFSGLKNRG